MAKIEKVAEIYRDEHGTEWVRQKNYEEWRILPDTIHWVGTTSQRKDEMEKAYQKLK